MDGEQKTIVGNNSSLKNGLHRCTFCGGTDISLEIESGKLKCNMCRNDFFVNVVEQDDVEKINGEKIEDGAKDIDFDAKSILSFKCSSCGATIVVNIEDSTLARCHWCRHFLSINEQVPNGAVPDMILPFSLEKKNAEEKIRDFVKKRAFYAHPAFLKEFSLENVIGVYLPYMVVDINGRSKLIGQGEHLVRSYSIKTGNYNQIRYDVDLYNVSREFDLLINDLTIEASAEKLNQNTKLNTNNVINAIMPFDTENCVRWNANFLRGFASEKRDLNVEMLRPILINQAKDIARSKANETLTFYGRGIKWEYEDLKVNGISWKSAYLPVWLYSYFQKEMNLIHYCAVNGRTGEMMGSIPINKVKLFFVSVLIEILGVFVGTSILLNIEDEGALLGLLGYTVGFIYYFSIWRKYRNPEERHFYEKETMVTIKNLKKVDDFVEHLSGLSNSSMIGANNFRIDGKLNCGDDGVFGKVLEEMDRFNGRIQ